MRTENPDIPTMSGSLYLAPGQLVEILGEVVANWKGHQRVFLEFKVFPDGEREWYFLKDDFVAKKVDRLPSAELQ
ncbi:MAG TPA: hypothetical protein VGC58_01525 [Candidatus Paceibacterota bacterium]